jgi:type II secretory pathway pseudopilin PulG
MRRKVASYLLPVASKGERRSSAFTGNWQLATSNYSPAFTLVEMLTVLGIIILILATAIPVWNTLTGNHSLAAAQNEVASALAVARADAISTRQVTGIFFFIDPATDAVALAEVQADPQGGTNATGATTYTPQNICAGANNLFANYGSYNNGPLNALELVNYYVPPPPTSAANPGPGTFTYYRDVTILPANVGIALYNNTYGYYYSPTSPVGGQPFDRYTRLGAILFDATGQVISIPFAVQVTRTTPYYYTTVSDKTVEITPVSQLGRRLGLFGANQNTTNTNGTGDLASDIQTGATAHTPATPPVYPLISQVGLLFYDRDAFLNQKTSTSGYAGQSFTDLDIDYLLPTQAWPVGILQTSMESQKADEEAWLDQNGIAVMVSPFNGSLIAAK